MEEKDLNTPQPETQVQDTPTPEEATEAAAPTGDPTEGEAPAAEATEAEQLAAAQAEIAELKDKILRQAADFANFRKHSMATHTELVLNGGKKVIEQLLPILDDMERAETNMTQSDDVATLREGLSLIFQKFMRTLEQQGLQKMDTAGAAFDTDYHEAVALFPTEEEEKKNHIQEKSDYCLTHQKLQLMI